jgi:predicted  nucleic acid-binding Zn-ribbon protein
MSAPIRHTCPDIDKVISNINEAIKLLSAIPKMEDIELIKQYADYANDELYRLDDILEDLRSSNDALRNWGHDLEKQIEELENAVYELQNQSI